MPDEELDRVGAKYEEAEAEFLAAVRENASRGTLASAAALVAEAATTWNAEAYRRFHESTGEARGALDLTTERTEVLDELWADVAEAYGSNPSNT